MNIIKENVELIIAEAEFEKYKKLGFHIIGEPSEEDENHGTTLKNMKVPELKQLAKDLGIEGADSLNKGELLKVLGE